MTDDMLGVGGLADVIAALAGTRLVLLCFPRQSGPRSDEAGRFIYEVSSSFGGLVAVLCVGPEVASELAREFAASATITLALFVGGKEVARSVGEGGETMMRKMIERYADAVGSPSVGGAAAS
jgi:hypothetical protein